MHVDKKAVAEFIDSDSGDKVNSGIGLSYRTARLHWLGGSVAVRQPYAGVNVIPPIRDL
jgi:hypothetical protein